MMIRIPSQPLHRISLKTDKVAAAKERARHEFISIQTRIQSGKPLREMTFEHVAKKLVAELKQEKSDRLEFGKYDAAGKKLRHEQTLTKKINYIENYMIPFFKDKEINQITDSDVSNLKLHYATYWTKGDGVNIKTFNVIKNGKEAVVRRRPLGVASRNTINNFVMCLNEVFSYAKIEFNTTTKAKKTFYVDAEPDARSSFTMEQYKHLVATQEGRIESERRNYHKDRLRGVIWLLEFAVWSGLRPAELKNLKWGQIEKVPTPSGGQTLQFKNVTSKDLKPRNVVCLGQIMRAYHELTEHMNRVPDPAEYVFHGDGDYFKTRKLEDGFQVLAQKAGLWLDERGKYRTLGSLRHTYAQQMIHYMEPFNLYKLAHNMGTSEKQIRNHYAADINMREDIVALSGKVDPELATVQVFNELMDIAGELASEQQKVSVMDFIKMKENSTDDQIVEDVKKSYGDSYTYREILDFLSMYRTNKSA